MKHILMSSRHLCSQALPTLLSLGFLQAPEGTTPQHYLETTAFLAENPVSLKRQATCKR